MNNSFFGGDPNNDENNLMSDINVTPLVDVMLVLLIVFIITMPVLFTQLRLDFPTTSNLQDNKSKDIPLIIKITLDKDGNYYLDDRLIKLDDLEIYIKDKLLKQDDKSKVIFALNAEVEVKYGQLIKLIEVIQKSGGIKIGYMEEVR